MARQKNTFPVFRATTFYRAGAHGWTETWFVSGTGSDSAAYNAAMVKAKLINTSRLTLANSDVTSDFIRISVDTVSRDALGYLFKSDDAASGTFDSLTPDRTINPRECVKMRLQLNTSGYSIRLLHGVPSVCAGSTTPGTWDPTDDWETAFAAYVEVLKTNAIVPTYLKLGPSEFTLSNKSITSASFDDVYLYTRKTGRVFHQLHGRSSAQTA